MRKGICYKESGDLKELKDRKHSHAEEELEPGFAEAMRQVCSLVLLASSLLQFSLV